MNMSTHRVFFLLLSFWNSAFLSIQAPIQGNKEIPGATLFIDFENEALKMLSITAGPGSTLDWKSAFLKLAPVAIQSANLAVQNANLAVQNALDAGRYHFILLSRNKFVLAEENYCSGLPQDNNEFIERIKSDSRFKDVPKELISCKKHSKAWLWMLVYGNSKIFTQLEELRNRLNNDAYRFLWFVTQVQLIFDVFDDDVHSPSSSLLDPKHVDINNIGKYLYFLHPDVKNAMKIYYETEGFNVDVHP